MKAAGLVAFLCVLAGLAGAEEVRWSLFFETGSYNHAYQDRQYITRATSSFPVWSYNLGLEAQGRAEGRVLGFGLSQSTIASGRYRNFDQYEVQPGVLILVPYVFAGHDWTWIAVELGLGFYLTAQELEERAYLEPDGSSAAADPGGWGWNRSESFTLINGLFRLGEERGLHLKLRFAREDFSITENLFNLAFFLPWDENRLWTSVSLSSVIFIWGEEAGMLRSNQRWYLGYDRRWGALTWGLRFGILVRSVLGGQGEVDLVNRLSGGISLGLRL